MNKFRTWFLLTIVALFFAVPEQGYAKVYASYVRITQDYSTAPFDGSFADGTGAAIRFFLNQPADSVIIDIVPAAGGAAVRHLKASSLLSGDNAVLWTGDQTNGTPAPVDAYRVDVTAYHSGYASYTAYGYITSATSFIFTRGLGSLNNPSLRWFGFLYTVSNGGYVTGLARHASNGQQYGNKPDSAFLTTTGVPLGPNEVRYATPVDSDGYVYVIGLNDRRIYRFHTDTLNVQLFDSSAYGMRIQGLDVKGSGATKVLYVTGDSAVFRIPIGNESFNTVTPEKVVTVGSFTGKGLVFWDAEFAQDSSLYVVYRADSAIGALPVHSRGVLKFNLTGFTTAKTLADTVWTARMADGDPVTLSIYNGPTASASDDTLYMSHDVGAPSTEASGIYAFTNLNAASPTRTLAWADPDNNTTSARGSIVTDVLGNVIYFENSNEQVVLVSPPSGPNSYKYRALDSLKLTASGTVRPLLTLSEARADSGGTRKPHLQGDTVRVVGIVNSVNIQTTNFGYFMQDDNAGIEIFKAGLSGAPTLAPGYRVMVTGKIDFFSGTTEITPAAYSDISIIDTGNVVKTIPLTIGQYKANAESYESRRIQLAVVQPLNFTSANWPAAGIAANLNVWDGKDTLILRIDSDTEIDGSPFPTFPVKLTGVASQFANNAAADTGYQITPMFNSDFVPINTPPFNNFSLLTPANNSTVVLNDTAQVVSFSWRRAVDFNKTDTALVYQWLPVGFSAIGTGNGGKDSSLARTGKQMLTYLGSKDTVVLKWTVATKDPTNPVVYCKDTSSVKVIRGTITGVQETQGIPTVFALEQNYPNPFNPSTIVRFALPQQAFVTLKVYDILGREVATLVNEERSAGFFDVTWNGTNGYGVKVASGVYFYRVEAKPVAGGSTFISLKKMMLLK